MSQGKKSEEQLIAEFEQLIATGQSQESQSDEHFFGSLSRFKFDQYVVQLVRDQLGSNDSFSSEPVNMLLEKKSEAYSLKILVLTGLSLPSIPGHFWYRNGDKKYLFKNLKDSKWDQSTVQIFDNPTNKKLEVQFPIQKIELQLQEIVMEEKESERRFFDSVLSDVNNGEPHLKLLLTECVYQQSRQEEFKEVTKQNADFMKIRKNNYKANMQMWLKSLEIFTSNQKAQKSEMFVSQFNTKPDLLSQTEVDDFLKPSVKK